MDENKKLIDSLFAAYGKDDDAKRKAVYVAVLSGFPTEAIRMACRKAYLESKFLPSISELVANIKSLVGSMDEERRVKSWDEAWGEITNKMYSTPWGKKPEWSTPEIASAVNAFGWNALQTIEADKFTTASAQIRRYYEDACKRNAEQSVNQFILDSMNNRKPLLEEQEGACGARKLLGDREPYLRAE